MAFVNMKYFDAFFLILGIIFIISRIFDTTPLAHPEYVSDAVRGESTVAGILVGFTGFCVTYMVSTAEDIETKKWLKKRAGITVLLTGIGLLFIIMGFTNLVYEDDLLVSYKWVRTGLTIIVLLFIDTSLLIPLSEEEEREKKKE